MKSTLRTFYWIAIVVLIALPFLYVASYFALLDPLQPSGNYVVHASGHFIRTPRYRVGEGMSEAIFYPLLRIDQAFRPRYWSWPATQFGPWPGHTDAAGIPDEYSHGQDAWRP